MPAILFLSFVTMPIVAALSFDIDAFALFLILFCVVAGLASSPEALLGEEAVEDGTAANAPPAEIAPARRIQRFDLSSREPRQTLEFSRL